jgi:hypothetical protein
VGYIIITTYVVDYISKHALKPFYFGSTLVKQKIDSNLVKLKIDSTLAKFCFNKNLLKLWLNCDKNKNNMKNHVLCNLSYVIKKCNLELICN